MADFIPHEDTLKIEFQDLIRMGISQSTEWSGRLADLIPQTNKLKVISQSTEWSEGVADLLPHEDKLKVISQVADLIPDEDKWKVKSQST